VHLGVTGGFTDDEKDYDAHKVLMHNLEAYLYSGVTPVRAPRHPRRRSRDSFRDRQGRKPRCGGPDLRPAFHRSGRHGTEYFKQFQKNMRDTLLKRFTRIPKSAEEARQQVDSLKTDHVDCIKAISSSARPRTSSIGWTQACLTPLRRRPTHKASR